MRASAILAALSVATLACPPILADDEPTRTISVTGTGEVSAPPDMATISTGVTTQAKTAEEALQQNNQAMEKVLQTLKDKGVSAKDVQTSSFNVRPVYEQDDRGRQKPEITGYEVRNQVHVHVRKLSDLGEMLDALVQAGSNQISGISFGVDDESGIMNQARSRAIQNARERADVYAQAAGVKVGAVRQISEQQVSPPRPMQMAFARAEAAGVPVATGEQQFTATVHVVYELEGAD